MLEEINYQMSNHLLVIQFCSINRFANHESEGLSNLTYLNLSNNRINDAEPLKKMSKLQDLTLDGNPLGKGASTATIPMRGLVSQVFLLF